MDLNHDLIQERFEDIRQSLQRLDEFKALPEASFLADQDLLDIASYRLQLAIEAALQICFHISAKTLNRVPKEYAECFGILSEAGIISPALGRNLQQMARFRTEVLAYVQA